MNTLGEAQTTEDLKELISKLKIKIQQNKNQIKKNNLVMLGMIEDAEATSEGDEKQEKIKKIEKAMAYNEGYIKAKNEAERLLKDIEEALQLAPKLFSASKTPTSKPKFTHKKGGKYKKSRKHKKSRKYKK